LPKVAVGISYFNNVRELPRLLDPIHKHVDLIIGIDGRYPLFKWPSNISTDGSTELLIEKYNAVVEVNKSPVEQIDKRNQYLEIADKADMDFVLVLDSDDYLHADYQDWATFYKQLEKLPKDERLANIWFWMNPAWQKNWNVVKDNEWREYTRIIRPKEIRYDITHWQYIDVNNPHVFDIPTRTIDGCRFNADSLLRTRKYKKAGYDWAYSQMLEENARMETPRAKRMRLNYWIRDIKKIIQNPNTKVILDNTEDKITQNLK
jgi:hypothetical protein